MTPTKAALAIAVVLAAPAFASANDANTRINACKAEIKAQLATTAPEAVVDFRKIKSSSRKATVSFRVKTDDTRGKVRCVAKSDAPVELVWGETLKPQTTLMVEKKVEKAGGN